MLLLLFVVRNLKYHRQLPGLGANWDTATSFIRQKLVTVPNLRNHVSRRSHLTAFFCIFSYSGFHITVMAWPGAMKQTRPLP
jgi:hypothetical protein